MNILKELNQLDINDLKNVDIKSVLEKIKNRPDILINILLITISLFVTIFLYTKYKTSLIRYNKDLAVFSKRIETVNEYKVLIEKRQNFTNSFPNTLNIDHLSDKVSEFAIKNKIQIIDFKPAAKVHTGFYDYNSVALTIKSPNYDDMIAFVENLEKTDNPIRIEKWSMKMINALDPFQKGYTGENVNESYLTADLRIAAIELIPDIK